MATIRSVLANGTTFNAWTTGDSTSNAARAWSSTLRSVSVNTAQKCRNVLLSQKTHSLYLHHPSSRTLVSVFYLISLNLLPLLQTTTAARNLMVTMQSDPAKTTMSSARTTWATTWTAPPRSSTATERVVASIVTTCPSAAFLLHLPSNLFTVYQHR